MIRQYDICVNTDRSSKARIPYLIVLQADLLSPLQTLVVAPVLPERKALAISKLNPIVRIGGKAHCAIVQELAAVPRSRLGPAAANVSAQHAEFMAAIDLLFAGF